MQQENEHVPEFQDHDARTWASFGRLASRWERTSGLDREEMLNELLQGYLCGEIWPVILPNLYGGHEMLAASPARPGERGEAGERSRRGALRRRISQRRERYFTPPGELGMTAGDKAVSAGWRRRR